MQGCTRREGVLNLRKAGAIPEYPGRTGNRRLLELVQVPTGQTFFFRGGCSSCAPSPSSPSTPEVHPGPDLVARSHGPRRRGRAGGNCRILGSKGGRHGKGSVIRRHPPDAPRPGVPALLRAGRESAVSHHWRTIGADAPELEHLTRLEGVEPQHSTGLSLHMPLQQPHQSSQQHADQGGGR